MSQVLSVSCNKISLSRVTSLVCLMSQDLSVSCNKISLSHVTSLVCLMSQDLSVSCYKQAAQCSYFSYFFLYFQGFLFFSYILIPNPIFFHQIPIFFKMLQIIMKYQGKIMEFWFEMPVLMSVGFIFSSLASLARNLINKVFFSSSENKIIL